MKLFDGHLRFRVGAHLDERKPRPCPVELSRGTKTEATEPACANNCSSSDSCTWYERFPTLQPAAHVTLLTRALHSRAH